MRAHLAINSVRHVARLPVERIKDRVPLGVESETERERTKTGLFMGFTQKTHCFARIRVLAFLASWPTCILCGLAATTGATCVGPGLPCLCPGQCKGNLLTKQGKAQTEAG